MQDFFGQFLSLSTLVFCLMVFSLVWVQRRAMELMFPKLPSIKSWSDFWVPLGPLGTGAIAGILCKQYPYPEMFLNSVWYDRAAYGIACGLISGLIYQLVKRNLISRISSTTDTSPPSNDPSQI